MGCTRRWRHAGGTVTAASPRVSGLSPPGGRPRGGSLRVPVDVTPVEAHTESLRVCPRVWRTPSCGGAACGRGPVPPPPCRRLPRGRREGDAGVEPLQNTFCWELFFVLFVFGGFFLASIKQEKEAAEASGPTTVPGLALLGAPCVPLLHLPSPF